GLWLVIPWWLPFAYGVVVVWTIARRLRGKDVSTPRPLVVSWLAVTVLIGGLTMLLAGIVGVALASRRPPGADHRASGHARGGAIRALPRTELWRGSGAHQPRRPTRPRASSGRSHGVLHLWRSGPGAVSGASRVRGGWRG